MSRRRHGRRLVLVLVVVVVVVLLVVLVPDRSAPDVSDTIQRGSRSGLPTYSRKIARILSEERRIIRAEMEGYQFPKGLHGSTARSLADLVPELGGRPVISLVITTVRSGSSFLGEVLNSHPANFYLFEPLHCYRTFRIREEPSASEAITMLKALLSCNYTGLRCYLEYVKQNVVLCRRNDRLWKQTERDRPLCWSSEFLNPFCRLFPFLTVKIIGLKLSLVERLLADKSLNVRVLLLVRDPRGTLQSRKKFLWCRKSPECREARYLCSDLVADYASAKEFVVKYPDSFRVVRYEQLSMTPYRSVKELFQFLGLDFHPNVQRFLDTHTEKDVGGAYSTYRHSASAPFHWRHDLSYEEVSDIQQQCKQAMDAWGYVQAHNATHQREFNPVVDYRLA